MSFRSLLNSSKVEDQALLAFLRELADFSDKLNANLTFGKTEPEVLAQEGIAPRDVQRVLQLVPEILIVKSLRFLEDQHGLKLSSAESMGCRIGRSTAQSINSGALTAIQFDTEEWDTDDMHDNATNNTRITFNHEGKYVIGGAAAFDDNVTGYRGLDILKNGATQLAADLRMTITVAGVDTYVATPVTCDYFVRGDYIELRAIQNSGGALNLAAVSHLAPIFWAHRVS